MSTREIVKFFGEHFPNVGLTEDLLKEQKLETLISTYRCLIGAIFALPENFFDQDENDYNSGFATLICLTQSCLEDINPTENAPYDFTVTDLIMPKLGRTGYFLKTLIHFYTFIMERMSDVDEVFNEMENYKRELDEDKEQLRKLEEEINVQKNKNEAATRKLNSLGANRLKLLDEVNKAQSLKEDTKALAQQKRNQLDELQRKLEALCFEQEECERISKQLVAEIVTSPDKMNSEIKRLEEEVANVGQAISDYKKQSRNYTDIKSKAEDVQSKIDEFELRMKQKLSDKINIINEEEKSKQQAVVLFERGEQNVYKAERDFNTYDTNAHDKLREVEDAQIKNRQKIEIAKNIIRSLKE